MDFSKHEENLVYNVQITESFQKKVQEHFLPDVILISNLRTCDFSKFIYMWADY